MADFLERTRLLIGSNNLERIRRHRVFLAGLGGVGSYVAETLVRSGIGYITLLDSDVISESNINRQLIALHSTIGKKKTDVMKNRLLDINPECQVTIISQFMRVGHMSQVLTGDYEVVVDTIDILNCKLDFLIYAYNNGYCLYSSMGAGNRTDPTKIETGDLFESRNCRLAKVIRKKLRQVGITKGIRAVWSTEIGHAPSREFWEPGSNRPIHGTISAVPALFGITLAGLIIADIIGKV